MTRRARTAPARKRAPGRKYLTRAMARELEDDRRAGRPLTDEKARWLYLEPEPALVAQWERNERAARGSAPRRAPESPVDRLLRWLGFQT